MGLGGDVYQKDLNPRSQEEKVVLYAQNAPIGDKRVRPTVDDERSREEILMKETKRVDEVLTTGEM